MQWGLSGQVTWTAPRRVALATVPVLAAVVIALALANPDRGLASPLPVLVLSLGFLFLQTVHLNKLGEAAERTLQALPHA